MGLPASCRAIDTSILDRFATLLPKNRAVMHNAPSLVGWYPP
jgi:hypothetical protein